MFDSLMRQLAAVVSKGKQCAICDNKSALVFASLFVEMSAHKSETSEALSRSRHEMTVVICTRCAKRQRIATVSTPLIEPILEQVKLSGETRTVDMTELYHQDPLILSRKSELGFPIRQPKLGFPKGAWVCPHCGHAHSKHYNTCANCKGVNTEFGPQD